MWKVIPVYVKVLPTPVLFLPTGTPRLWERYRNSICVPCFSQGRVLVGFKALPPFLGIPWLTTLPASLFPFPASSLRSFISILPFFTPVLHTSFNPRYRHSLDYTIFSISPSLILTSVNSRPRHSLRAVY